MKRIASDFCDSVLGPRHADIRSCGEIVEVYSQNPDQLAHYIEKMLMQEQPVALLGTPLGYLGEHAPENAWIMPAESAGQILFAAQELVKSEAIQTIVLQDLFLRNDYSPEIVAELKKLRTKVCSSNVKVVLLNPDTSERKMILSELQTICSHQISL